MKSCTKCGVMQTLDSYHKASAKSDGLNDRCKPCIKKWHQDNYLRNKESILSQNKRWRDDNPYHHKSLVKRWQHENREKELARLRLAEIENKVHLKSRRKKYYESNKDKAFARCATRRARKMNQDGGATSEDLERIKRDANDSCHYCHNATDGVGNFDHKKALAKGGLHSADNLVWSCPTCNKRKHVKSYDYFKRQIREGVYV